jgi:hypothetical protein
VVALADSDCPGAGDCERPVRELNAANGSIEPPRVARGPTTGGPLLAEIDQDVVNAGVEKQTGNPIGDIALGDTVERDGHASTLKNDRSPLNLNRPPADKTEGLLHRPAVGHLPAGSGVGM